MLIQLSRNWRWLTVRGIALILFGIIVLTWHGTTLGSFMNLFASFALVDGLLTVFAVLIRVAKKRRWWILLHGLVSVSVAVLTWIWTESTTLILLYTMAAWALIMGLLELGGAWELRRNISNERLFILTGMASTIFAGLLVRFPFSQMSALSIAQIFATFAILFGLLTLAFSLNLRSLGKYIHLVTHR